MKHIPMIALVIVLLTSCKTQVAVAPQQHDSIAVRTEYRVDSVYIDRWHTEYMKGDTVYRVDSFVDYRYRVLTKTDSVVVTDSIPYPVEVPVVTNEVPKFYKQCTWGFWILIAIILGIIIWKIVKAVKLR